MVVLVTLLTTGLVVGLLLMEVWYRIGVVNMGYEMTRLTRERQQLLEDRKRLKIEATVNARTERVDQIGRGSLGLVSVRVDQVVKLKKGVGVALSKPASDEPVQDGQPRGL
jgi:cell division protein FtsL